MFTHNKEEDSIKIVIRGSLCLMSADLQLPTVILYYFITASQVHDQLASLSNWSINGQDN